MKHLYDAARAIRVNDEPAARAALRRQRAELDVRFESYKRRFEEPDADFSTWLGKALRLPEINLRALEWMHETEIDAGLFDTWMRACIETPDAAGLMPARMPPHQATPIAFDPIWAMRVAMDGIDGADKQFGLPRINVGSSNLPEQMHRISEILAAPCFSLYRRGGILVEMSVHRTAGHAECKTTPVTEPRLVELISRVATFQKWDARTKKAVMTQCPDRLARTYLARDGVECNLPRLNGIIHAPTLRFDRTILDVPGYDRETGLFLDTGGIQMPDLLEDPEPEQIEDAFATLLDLLAEFPFVADVDRSVALAAILTACVRKSLPSAPMFAFTAPTAGTGKSCLVNVISLIATGRPAAGLSWGDDPAENTKRIDSALLADAPAIQLDNVTAPLGGDRLNQMLTESLATVRVLGQSKNVEVPCNAFVTANGNNLQIAADMTRRTLLCRLDANLERPETRKFNGNPENAVRADRGRYLAAALTILQGDTYALTMAAPKPALGSFEVWSSWVRSEIVRAGYADPVASIENAREGDPRRAELAAVLGQWDAALGNKQASSKQVIDASTQAGEFREALLAVAGQNGSVNTGKLGRWLRSHKGQLSGGMKIEAGTVVQGTGTWVLVGGERKGVGPWVPQVVAGAVASEGDEFASLIA